jgi:hypothetical protein
VGSLIVYNKHGANAPKASYKQSAVVPDESLSYVKCEKYFFKINRRYNKHQYLVVIEQEKSDQPSMQLTNNCENVAIVVQQVANRDLRDVNILDASTSSAFAWSDDQAEKLLQVEFFKGRQYKAHS